jgi:hypothetical protein
VLIYEILKALGYRTAIFSSQNEKWGGMENFHKPASLDRFAHAANFTGTTNVATGDLGFAHWAEGTGGAVHVHVVAVGYLGYDLIQGDVAAPVLQFHVAAACALLQGCVQVYLEVGVGQNFGGDVAANHDYGAEAGYTPLLGDLRLAHPWPGGYAGHDGFHFGLTDLPGYIFVTDLYGVCAPV